MGNVATGARGQYKPTEGEIQAEPSFANGTPWTQIRHGVSVNENTPVTIWRIDRSTSNELDVNTARATIRRLKLMRHPGVLKFIDDNDTKEGLTLITERMKPLHEWLSSRRESLGSILDEKATHASITWGLYTLARTLKWLHKDCNKIHGGLCLDSVFVSKGGDWRLGGLENSFDADDTVGMRQSVHAVVSSGRYPQAYFGPERDGMGLSSGFNSSDSWAIDSWSFGVLILQIFNYAEDSPSQAEFNRATVEDIKRAVVAATNREKSKILDTQASASDRGIWPSMLPSSLRQIVIKLLAPIVSGRISIENAISAATQASGYMDHPLVHTLTFLEDMALKEPAQKQVFFKQLPEALEKTSDVPADVAKYKILPSLMHGLEYGAAGGGGTIVLAPMLQIGTKLSQAEYQKDIVPCVIRLFKNPDRATRLQLLQHLDTYAPHLDSATINGELIHNLIHGFSDSTETLRQATIKAAVVIAPHLKKDVLLGTLLKSIRRCLRDELAAVRVNTVIAIGRLTPHFAVSESNYQYAPSDYDPQGLSSLDSVKEDNSQQQPKSSTSRTFLGRAIFSKEPAVQRSTVPPGVPDPRASAAQEALWECFGAAMKDPHPAVRAAALRACGHVITNFSPNAVAQRILPLSVRLTLDKYSSEVRTTAISLLERATRILSIEDRRLSRVAAEEQAAQQAANNTTGMSAQSSFNPTPSNDQKSGMFSIASAGASAVEWAVGSLASKWPAKSLSKTRPANDPTNFKQPTSVQTSSNPAVQVPLNQISNADSTTTALGKPANGSTTSANSPRTYANASQHTGWDTWDDDLFNTPRKGSFASHNPAGGSQTDHAGSGNFNLNELDAAISQSTKQPKNAQQYSMKTSMNKTDTNSNVILPKASKLEASQANVEGLGWDDFDDW